MEVKETSAGYHSRYFQNRLRYSRMEFLPIRPVFRLHRNKGSAVPAEGI
jgi:hypothetical protein